MKVHRNRPLRLIAGLLFLAGFTVMSWPRIQMFWYEYHRPKTLPATQSAETFLTKPESTTTEGTPAEPEPTPEPALPTELNLAVPFTSQAPFGNWDEAHGEYCEEASAYMAERFFTGEPIASPDEADAAMVALHEWQVAEYGYFESTTAEETARMIRENYGLTVTLSTDVTAQSIRQTLANGELVILPVAGRELGNPYFQTPGPIYHMLVVKGYTANDRFITNEPGTRRGADYIYTGERLLGAVGDYNHGDPANGVHVMLIVGPAQE